MLRLRSQTQHVWEDRTGFMYKLDSSAPRFPLAWKFLDFCHKPTTFYIAQSFLLENKDRCPLLILGCIWREWFCRNPPSIEYGHFFANPVRITPTGPTTISGILEAHRSICDQAPLLLEGFKRGQTRMSTCPTMINSRLLPLSRAIIAILDQLPPGVDVYPDGRICLERKKHMFNCLLVLAGDNAGLSRRVTFDRLRTQALPLARSDYRPGDDGVDVIRVSLAAAVRFIADLEREKEAASRETQSSAVELSLCPKVGGWGPPIASADKWINEVMRQAADKGKENVSEIRHAMQRIEEA